MNDIVPIKRGGTGANAKIFGFTALSPATAKGELVVSDGLLNVAVPAGLDGQVLVADPNGTRGVRWGSSSSAGLGKVLGRQAPAATTETLIYAVPAGYGALGHSIWICNRSTQATIRIGVKVGGGGGALANADYIFYELTVPANDTIVRALESLLCLAALDEVVVRASSANVTFTLFGAEILGATTLKCLGSSAPGTSETVLYTVPASTETRVHSIWITNRGADETVDFGVSVGGGALANEDYLLKGVQAAGTMLFQGSSLLCLSAADEVRVKSSAGNVTYKIFGEERAL